MRAKSKVICMAAVGLIAASGFAHGQSRPDLGKREFETNCAMCHGLDGRGTGVMSTYLNRQPANLTTLAKGNGGVLPMDRMFAMIEGSRDVPGHGTREMPAWGNDYRAEAARLYFEVPYDPEIVVRAKVLSLIEYINRLQAK